MCDCVRVSTNYSDASNIVIARTIGGGVCVCAVV